MARSKRSPTAVLAVALVAMLVPTFALAAAPLLATGKDYSTKGYKQRVSVSLVTSATNPKKIEPGSAPLGSQFAVGGIYVQCPGAPRSTATTSAPFAGIAFPALKLKLSHGKYSFSKKLQVSQFLLATSLTKPVKLKVLFTGTVRSAKLIVGTVKITGKQCATTASYQARATTVPVAPGQ